MGIERLMLLIKAKGKELPPDKKPIIYIIPASEDYSFEAMRIVNELREAGVYAITDLGSRSIKAQMKYANKRNAVYTAVLGGDEIESRTLSVKKMESGEKIDFELDTFVDDFAELAVDALFENVLGGADGLFDDDDGSSGANPFLSLLNGGKK